MDNNFFDSIIEFPSPEAQVIYNKLVGLDTIKTQIHKEGCLVFNPQQLNTWSKKFYKKNITLIDQFKSRIPLFIFAGDVGTGKTSLAESFGDFLARDVSVPVTLYSLSLKNRGKGLVGEMTQLISTAFDLISGNAKKYCHPGKSPSASIILLIDEADSLAQSREFEQMNHEDKAGVNALIRGIDNISSNKLPVVIIMCTNRLNSIDPAIQRRAAAIFNFCRPNAEQRKMLLSEAFEEIGFSKEQINKIVEITGESENRKYGYTYSDIRHRFLPNIILDAFPDSLISFENVVKLANDIQPTPPFKNS